MARALKKNKDRRGWHVPGDEEVIKRLADRDVTLGYPAHADPEHKLLLQATRRSYRP